LANLRRSAEFNPDLCDRIGEVFLAHGFNGATITAIASSARLSKATLYHHFPAGKSQMAEMVIRQAIAHADRAVFSCLSQPKPAITRLLGMLDGFLEYTDQGNRACLIMVMGQSAPEPLRALIRQQVGDWRLAIEQSLCELRSVKPKRAARLAEETLCSLYGSLLISGLTAEPEVTQRAIKRLRKTYEACT
jgi:TetR/AcrR family transcriptional regulator, lmrAB and yxaGH operons repressor